jgi:hypothetical protein
MWLWMPFIRCPVERIKLMQLMVLILYLTFPLESSGLPLNYDKIKNQNLASTAPIEIKLKKDFITKSLEFKVEYSSQGERAGQRSDTANLVFRAQSHRWRFLEEPSRQGVLLFEGGRINLSTNPTYTSVIGKKFLEETLIYQIRIADLEKIAKAPYLEMQLGKLEGRVSEKQLNRIKEFLMELPAGNIK